MNRGDGKYLTNSDKAKLAGLEVSAKNRSLGYDPQAYRCSAGVWTYGVGATVRLDGRPVQKGDVCTKAEAEAMLTRDLAAFERAAKSLNG